MVAANFMKNGLNPIEIRKTIMGCKVVMGYKVLMFVLNIAEEIW